MDEIQDLLNFDFDSFQQNDDAALQCQLQKQRKAIYNVKRRIISTDTLLKKFYDKRDLVDQISKELWETKHQCKEHCIENKNSRETIQKLTEEKANLLIEFKILQDEIQQERYKSSASECKAEQYQCLAKDNETKCDVEASQNKLKTNIIKDQEQQIMTLRKDIKILYKHLKIFSDVTSGKVKMSKKLRNMLTKYKNNKEEVSDYDEDILEDIYFNEQNLNLKQKDKCAEKADILASDSVINKPGQEHCDSDGSNDLVCSEDTGRGSSVVFFSDSEKNLLSPDYSNNTSPEQLPYKSPPTMREDKAVSPIMLEKMVFSPIIREDKALSPIMLEKMVFSPIIREDKALSPINFLNENPMPCCTCSFSTNKQNVGSVPEVAAQDNPIFTVTDDNVDTTDNTFFDEIVDDDSNNDLQPASNENKEKECLKLNNSRNRTESDGDREISTIFDNVALHYNLITPIPSSPRFENCSDSNNKGACPEARKFRSEILQILNEPLKKIVDFMDKIDINKIVNVIDKIDINKIFDNNSSDNSHHKNSESVTAHSTRMNVIDQKQQLEECNTSHTQHQLNANLTDITCTSSINVENSIDNNYDDETETVHLGDITVAETEEHINDDDTDTVHLNDLSDEETVLVIVPDNDIEPVISESTFHTNTKNNENMAKEPEPCLQNVPDITTSRIMKRNNPSNICFEKQLMPEEIESTLEKDSVNESVTFNVDEDCEAYSTNNTMSNESISKYEKNLRRKNRLTKLEKLRNEVIKKKNKIKYVQVPSKKTRKRIISKKLVNKKKIVNGDTIAERNDKKAYEKALAVVAEMREKQKSKENCGQKLNIIRQKDAPVHPNRKAAYSRVTRSQKNSESNILVNNVTLDSVDKNSSINKFSKDSENTIGTRITRSQRSQQNSNNSQKQNNSQNNNSITKHNSSVLHPKLNECCIIVHDIVKSPNSDARIKSSTDSIIINEFVKSPTGAARKRSSSDGSTHFQSKRVLRSSGVCCSVRVLPNEDITQSAVEKTLKSNQGSEECADKSYSKNIKNTRQHCNSHDTNNRNIIVYDDDDTFKTSLQPNDCIYNSNKMSPVSGNNNKRKIENSASVATNRMQESILCRMIDKYGIYNNIFVVNNKFNSVENPCYLKLQNAVSKIVESQCNDAKDAMIDLVDKLSKHSLEQFAAGLVVFLKDPQRKTEMYNRMNIPSAPQMSRTEQILLFVVNKLNQYWSEGNLMETIFYNIEYCLFKLNSTPDFDVIESLSHFYAILCRYHRYKNRLRQFVLDAMYCMNYKSIAVLKQCIIVWFHILPLSHMGQAKSPIVVCLIYLLHFHKCKDFSKRAEEMRSILHNKYFYDMNDWNDTRILEYIQRCILDIKDNSAERKILKTTIIILSKRKGAQWCHKHMIKNILMPIIENEKSPNRVREFCVSLLGPLMKPFPANMTIHCEIIINQLFDMLEDNCSQKMKEAIYSSLTYYCSQTHLPRVVRSLLSWNPESISPEFENVLKDYVRSKKIPQWLHLIRKTVY